MSLNPSVRTLFKKKDVKYLVTTILTRRYLTYHLLRIEGSMTIFITMKTTSKFCFTMESVLYDPSLINVSFTEKKILDWVQVLIFTICKVQITFL